MSQQFNFENLVALCRRPHDQTQRSAARAIDRSLVAGNWLFGWYIVEYEQNSADRAEYGSQTLKRLSAALKTKIAVGSLWMPWNGCAGSTCFTNTSSPMLPRRRNP